MLPGVDEACDDDGEKHGHVHRRGVLKDLDLSKVPPKDLIKKLTDELRQKYPNVHKVLVAERNTIMAKKISALMQQYPDKKIVAVIGAGHEEEMLDLIRNHKETRISYEFSIGPM